MTLPANPRVTIVTPSFNQARYLEATIQSIHSQDYPSIEHIVIDGGSSDGSVDVIRRYAERLAYWVAEPDRGQSDAINKGMARATGQILTWLNSDDLYASPVAVRRAVETFHANPHAALVYGTGAYVDEEGRFLRPLPAQPFDRARVLRGHPFIAQPAAFFTAEAWRTVGPLRAEYHYCMDMDLWYSIAERYDAVYVPEHWVHYRLHGESKTGMGWAPFDREARAIRRRHHRRLHLLRRAVARPDLFATPSMMVFLAARMLPRPMLRAINRARGLQVLPDD